MYPGQAKARATLPPGYIRRGTLWTNAFPR
jgi:hypothetical protein